MQIDDITRKNDNLRRKDSSSYQRYLHLAVALSNCFTLACMGSLVTPSWSLSPVGFTIILLKLDSKSSVLTESASLVKPEDILKPPLEGRGRVVVGVGLG